MQCRVGDERGREREQREWTVGEGGVQGGTARAKEHDMTGVEKMNGKAKSRASIGYYKEKERG